MKKYTELNESIEELNQVKDNYDFVTYDKGYRLTHNRFDETVTDLLYLKGKIDTALRKLNEVTPYNSTAYIDLNVAIAKPFGSLKWNYYF